MADKILNSFDVWIGAQGWKSKLRLKSVDNISLDGIKRLRELIIELAVRGKLVAQDPTDEPSSRLIEKIIKEKEQLIKEGRINEQKPLSKIRDEEKSFVLPKGWEFVRLGDITQINPRNDVKDDVEASFVPMTLVSTSYSGEHESEIRFWAEIKKGFTHFADGDIGIAKITPCFENSKAIILTGLKNGVGAGTTELLIARPYGKLVNPRYILLNLKSPWYLKLGESKMTGTAGQKRVPRNFFEQNPLPLPPLAEQHRIVAKVDELMALCDELEQHETNHLKSHQLLVETLLGTLTQAKDAAEFQTAWATLGQHFDDLFITEDSIDQLKQTILQLAVMGKLVPQDPKDEPASVLLERIKKEKERLVEEGKIKREKSISEITDAEKHFNLPNGWEWVRMGQVSDIQRGSSPRPKGDPLYFSSEVTSNNWISISDISKYTTNHVLMKTDEYLTDLGTEYSRLVNEGELIVAVSGSTTGKCCLTGIKGYIYDGLAVIRLIGNYISPNYQLIYMLQLYSFMNNSKFGAAFPNINTMFLSEMLFPFPPLEVQKQIVKTVDELFVVCDRLKERITESQNVANQMADSILEQVV